MELQLKGFESFEAKRIKEILSKEPLDDGLLKDFSPVLIKTGPGTAHLEGIATGTGRLQKPYKLELQKYLDLEALVGQVSAHLHNPEFLK